MGKFRIKFEFVSKSIWFWLFINTVLFTTAAYLLPFRFEIADDNIMCLLASGAYSGIPDFHLVFINAIYGYFLQILYGFTNAVEWYTILFVIWHIISMSIITWYILSQKELNKWIKIVFVLLNYAIWMRIIILFTFTTTAGLLAFAAMLLIHKKQHLIIAFVLFIIATLIRFQAAMLVGCMLSIFFVIIYKKNWKEYILLGSLCIASFGLHFADSLFYKGEWAGYKLYNKERGLITDNHNAVKINHLPEGITQDDYDLLLSFFSDPNIIKTTHLQEINENISKVPFYEKIQNIVVLKRSYSLILALVIVIFSFISIFILLLLNKRKTGFINKDVLLLCVVYPLFMLFIIGMVSVNSIFKYRAFICMLFPTFFILSYCSMYIQQKFGRIILLLILCLWGSIWCLRSYNIYHSRKGLIKEWKEEDFFLESYGDCNISGMPCLVGMSPFKISQSILNEKCSFLGCYAIPTNKIRSHVDLIRDEYLIFEGKDCFTDKSQMVQRSLKNHYNIDTEIKIINTTSSFVIYKLVMK